MSIQYNLPGFYLLKKGRTQGHYVKIFTIFVNSKRDVRGHNLVVADLAVLEGAVSIYCLHSQDAVVLLSLNNGGFVGFLLKHWRVLVDVVHLDVDSRPDRNTTPLRRFVSYNKITSESIFHNRRCFCKFWIWINKLKGLFLWFTLFNLTTGYFYI